MTQYICDRCGQVTAPNELARINLAVRPWYKNGEITLEYCPSCFQWLKKEIPQIEETARAKSQQREERRRQREETK